MNLRSTSYSMAPAVPQSTSQEFEASICQVSTCRCRWWNPLSKSPTIRVPVDLQSIPTYSRAFGCGAWEPMSTSVMHSCESIHTDSVAIKYLAVIYQTTLPETFNRCQCNFVSSLSKVLHGLRLGLKEMASWLVRCRGV